MRAPQLFRVQDGFELFVGDLAVVVETVRFGDHFFDVVLRSTRKRCDRRQSSSRYLSDVLAQS